MYQLNQSLHQKQHKANSRSECYVSIDQTVAFSGISGFLPFGVLFVASDWLIDFSGLARLAEGDKLEVTNRGMLGLDG